MNRDAQARLRAADPAPHVAPYPADKAAAVLQQALGAPARTPPRRRRVRTVGAALGAGVVFAGGGGLAYAVFSQPAETAMQISCAVGTSRADFEQFPSVASVLDTYSGDPVADCAGEYERLEGASPPLVGYDTGQSYVTVVPADWPVPQDWKPLTETFRSDPARLELKHRLDDLIEGPQSQCRSADATEDLVRAELADLGLTGWTVERLEGAAAADGTERCGLAFVDDTGDRLVRVQGVEPFWGGTIEGPDIRDVIVSLRRDIVDGCLTLDQARRASENAVSSAGFDLADAKITAIEDPDAPCARVDFVPGGLVVVVLRGPAG